LITHQTVFFLKNKRCCLVDAPPPYFISQGSLYCAATKKALASCNMDHIFVRIGAILAHILLNIIIISYATSYDISGSWLTATGFFLLAFLLLVLFIKHLLSFINFIKNKSK
jgi:hypothetical protein